MAGASVATLSFLSPSSSILSHTTPNVSFLSSSLQRLTLTPQKPTFHLPMGAPKPKTTSPNPIQILIEKGLIEPVKPKPKPKPKDETAVKKPKAPKREDIFAVVMVGGRQFIVIPGRFITTNRLKGAEVDDKIILNKVLLVGKKEGIYLGKPVVTNAVVHAVVEEQLLDKKKRIMKYKRKKNYRRKIGHRQPITRIRITGITGYEDYPLSTLPAEASAAATPQTAPVAA